jgi:hypothetical protein
LRRKEGHRRPELLHEVEVGDGGDWEHGVQIWCWVLTVVSSTGVAPLDLVTCTAPTSTSASASRHQREHHHWRTRYSPMSTPYTAGYWLFLCLFFRLMNVVLNSDMNSCVHGFIVWLLNACIGCSTLSRELDEEIQNAVHGFMASQNAPLCFSST